MAVWERVEMPRPLPELVTAGWLRDLDDDEFREVLRSNLLPRGNDPGARRSWESCWRLLADWPDLQERAQEALSGFLSAVEAHLATDTGDRRAQRFQEQAENRWRHLDPTKIRRGGANATRGEQLLAAISTHRRVIVESGQEPRPADVALWAHLDPKRRRL